MGWQDTLEKMIDGYDAQISGLQNQIGSLQNKARDIQDQIEALDTTKLVGKHNTEQVLEAKRAALAIALRGTYTIRYGRGFGSDNLTSWYIYYHGDNPADPNPRVVYKFGGVGWDNNKTLLCLIDEFGFIDDYINVPISTGLYGLNGMFNLLNDGIDKLEDMIHKFETAKRRLESFAKSGVSGCLINPSF